MSRSEELPKVKEEIPNVPDLTLIPKLIISCISNFSLKIKFIIKIEIMNESLIIISMPIYKDDFKTVCQLESRCWKETLSVVYCFG